MKSFWFQKFFKQKYRCFYCDKSESISPEWICDECGSRNLFDSSGTILDTTGRGSNNRFCSTSSSFENTIFCDVCVNNQNVLLSILQSRDEEGVALELLKQDLEKRYPPVCSVCEPSVEFLLNKQQQKYKKTLSPQRTSSITVEKIPSRKKSLSYFSYHFMLFLCLAGTLSILNPFAFGSTHQFLYQRGKIYQILSLIGLITINFFYPNQTRSILIKKQKPSLLFLVFCTSATILATYFSYFAPIVVVSVLTVLHSLSRFSNGLKKSPIISTLTLSAVDTPPRVTLCDMPKVDKPTHQDKIQESIESLSISNPTSQKNSVSNWNLSPLSGVPWHATQGSLPSITQPQVRFDTNPNSVHWKMFSKPAFGTFSKMQTTPKKKEFTFIPPSSSISQEVQFRPQRFFAKQVIYLYFSKKLDWKTC
jgi:hypothetical protein